MAASDEEASEPAPLGAAPLTTIVRTLWVAGVVALLHLLGFYESFDRSVVAQADRLRPLISRDDLPLVLAMDARSIARWGPPPWSPATWTQVAEGLAQAGVREAWLVDPWVRAIDPTGPAGHATSVRLQVPRHVLPAPDEASLPTPLDLPEAMTPFTASSAALYLPLAKDGVLRSLSREARAGDLFGDSTFCTWTNRCPSGGPLALPFHRSAELPVLSLADVAGGSALASTETSRLALIGITASPWAERVQVGDAGHWAPLVEAVASAIGASNARSPALSLGALGDAALILAVLVAAGLFEAAERRLRVEVRLLVLPASGLALAFGLAYFGLAILPIGAVTTAAAAPPFLTALAGRRVALAVLRKAALLVAQDAWDSGWRSAQVKSHTELAYKLAALARNQTRSHRSAFLTRDGRKFAVHAPYRLTLAKQPAEIDDETLRTAQRSPRGAPADALVSDGLQARLFTVRSGRGIAGWWLIAWDADEPEPDHSQLGRMITRLSRNVELQADDRPLALHERLLDHVAAETASVRDLLVLASEERRRQVQTLHAVDLPVMTADLTGQALFVNRSLSQLIEETELGPIRSIRELVYRLRGESGLDEVMRALFFGLEPLRIPYLDPLSRLWFVSVQPVLAQDAGDERAVLGYVAWFQDRTDTVRLDDLRESVVEFSSARVRDALTVIIGYAGLARDRIDDSTTRVMMDTVHERAVQVNKALEDLKAVGQLAAAEHLTITVDARRLLVSVLDEVIPLADERDVTLRSFVPEIGLPIRVVPDDARDALAALLREAAATAPPGTEVVLRLDQDHQSSSIRVEWQGPGLDPLVREYCTGNWHLRPERLPEALRPFARVRRSFPYLDLQGTPGGGVAVSLHMHHGPTQEAR